MNTKFKIVLVVLLISVAILSLTACGGSKLTKENYDKITCTMLSYSTFQYEGGMTLSEVKGILGEPDDSASSTVMGVTATAYMWGNEKKNITVTFVNDQAKTKAQVGL